MGNASSATQVDCIVQRGAPIFLVGGKQGSPFVDVYAIREDAEQAILRYIFSEENAHWIGKLNAEQRCILWTLKTNNTPFDVILNYYNSVSTHDDQWVLTTTNLR